MSSVPNITLPLGSYSIIERAFISEEPSGLWPPNQNSVHGFHRKVFCDVLMKIALQLDLLLNEKFLDTTNEFLEAHEEELGLTLNPANVTLAQRRSALQARRKRGPFTNSLRRQVIESFIQGALTGGTPATFGTAGIKIGVSGIPLYSGLSGSASNFYTIVENVGAFSYQVIIDSRVTPDLTGLTRELTRITPAGISFTLTGGGGATLVQKTGGAKSSSKTGGTKAVGTPGKTGGGKSAAHSGAVRTVPGIQIPIFFRGA